MKETRFTCDKCGLSILPLDPAFDTHNVTGAGTLAVLQRVGGGVGHSAVPLEGWHFHYLCFCEVVRVILGALKTG